MKKLLSSCLLMASIFGLNQGITLAALSASQTVTATLTRTPPTPGGGGGGGGGAGGIVAGGVAGGAAAAGAGAFAFAPLLLAGLTPNSVISAAAPIGCVDCVQNFLQCAIMNHFCVKNYTDALTKMQNSCKFYLVQNNSNLINGSFDLHALNIPPELQNARKIKINITMDSQPYGQSFEEPDLALGLYKDINTPNLSKKFETQQFLHHYLMKRYDVPLRITTKQYAYGLQKLTGTIDMSEVANPKDPLQIAVRYTDGGFRKNMRNANPKAIVYAYLVEMESVK